MKCLNCGCNSDRYLCDNCTTVEVLGKIYSELRSFRPELCENPYLAEYAAGLTEKYAERNIIPEIFSYFDFETTEYYYCQYYKLCGDDRYEPATLAYLEKYPWTELRSQRLIYGLLNHYIPDDFIKPQKWCEWILESDTLSCDLYVAAAKYFGMIGEYDRSDEAIEKAEEVFRTDQEGLHRMFFSEEQLTARIEKQRADTLRYRTKKPYWPVTEARRRAVALFYDEKGIRYPRIENKPTKVPENKFSPLNECFEETLTDYCTFWCSEVFSVSGVKCIYQIAAVKIVNNQIVGTFENLIRPWDARVGARTRAAKEINVPVETLETSEDVDLVMPKFFDFVGDSVLVSTGALGNQAKLISRAARYSGMKEIKNELLDLLDLAADISSEFDLTNNTREYLLSYFKIEEGKTALEKATANQILYKALMNYGD